MATVYLLGGMALGGLGVAGLVESVFDVRRWLAAKRWSVAEGWVVYSRVHEQGGCHDGYTERLKLKYEFTVDGRTYVGHRVRAGQELDLTLGHGPGRAWSTAGRDAETYTPGAEVLVLYDPRNPKRCCLQTGGFSGILVKLAFCIGLLIGGLVLVGRAYG